MDALHYVRKEGFTKIGLDMLSGDSYEYPLYRLLETNSNGILVQYVNVENASVKYELGMPLFKPDAVLCLDCANDKYKWFWNVRLAGPGTVIQQLVIFSKDGQYKNHNEYLKALQSQ